MAAKTRRAYPRLDAALTWVEAQTEPITAEVERAASDAEFNAEGASAAVFEDNGRALRQAQERGRRPWL